MGIRHNAYNMQAAMHCGKFVITNYITVLKCFAEATLDASCDSSSISMIIPLMVIPNAKWDIKDENLEKVTFLKSQLRFC